MSYGDELSSQQSCMRLLMPSGYHSSGHIRRRHTARGKGYVGISDQPLASLVSSTITWRNPSTTCSLCPRAQADMNWSLQNQEPKHLPSSGILGTSNIVMQKTETTEIAYFLPNLASFSLTKLEHLWQRAVSSLLTNIHCPLSPGSSTSRHHLLTHLNKQLRNKSIKIIYQNICQKLISCMEGVIHSYDIRTSIEMLYSYLLVWEQWPLICLRWLSCTETRMNLQQKSTHDNNKEHQPQEMFLESRQ